MNEKMVGWVGELWQDVHIDGLMDMYGIGFVSVTFFDSELWPIVFSFNICIIHRK